MIFMLRFFSLIILFLYFNSALASQGNSFIIDVFGNMEDCRESINLDGQWEFKIDANDNGKDLGWQNGQCDFDKTILIPGVPQAQGIGEETERQKNYFWEPYWVRKHFRLKKIGPNKKIWLKIGGIFPAGQIYINGKMIGYTKSCRTAMRIDVTRFVISSGENLIAIKICDLPEIRLDGLWESPSFGKNWSGLYRSISLEITDRVCVTDICVRPMPDEKAVEVELSLSEKTGEPIKIDLAIKDGWRQVAEKKVEIGVGEDSIKTTIAFEKFKAWSIDEPKLYTLYGSVGEKDKFKCQFGMRKIETKGRKFYLNNEPVFLKVFGDDHYYLDTLAPSANKQWYIERLLRAKKYGFNAVKSCSDVIT